MMRTLQIIAAWLLLCGQAVAVPTASAPPIPLTAYPTPQIQVAQRTNWIGHKPYGNGMTEYPQLTFDRTSGNECIGVMELPDNYSAVQLAFGSDATSSAYTVQQAVVSGSAMYGPTSRPGANLYDYTGALQYSMVPVSFNNAGAVGDPFASIQAARNGDATSGAYTGSVIVASGGASGGNTVVLASSTTALMQGSFSLLSAMYISDGTGAAIPANTTFTRSGNTVTFSNTLTASLAVNQVLYISYVPLTFSLAIPASTNPVQPQWRYSDVIPVRGLFRTDGGVQAGDQVSGPGVPAGTVVPVGGVSPNQTSVSISQGLTATTSGQPAVSFYRTTTLTAVVPATIGYFLPLASLSGLAPGMLVQDANNDFPAGTVITSVPTTNSTQGVRLNNAPTNGLSSGASVTFTHLMYVASSNSGLTIGSQTINFPSTSSRPILTFRVAATAASGNTVTAYNTSTAGALAEQAAGLDLNLYYKASVAGTDIINNNIAAPNVATSTGCPVLMVHVLTDHFGVTVAAAGDSQTAGKTTVTDSANFIRRAAYSLSTPTLPIDVENFGISGQWGNDFLTAISQEINDNHPNVIYLQGMTRNSTRDSAAGYFAQLATLVTRAQRLNIRTIIGTQMPWGGSSPGDFIVAAPGVTNGTTIPVSNSVVNTLSGVAAYATGLPLGTVTLSMSHYFLSLTATAPVTLAAGTVIHTNQLTVASPGVTSAIAGSVVPLTSPFPVNNASCTLITPGGATLYENTAPVGATSVTLASVPAPTPLPTGTVLTLACNDNIITDRQGWISIEKGLAADSNSSVTFFDLYQAMEDPANPGLWYPAYTSDDVHANDNGQPVAATAFMPTLRAVAGL